MMRWMGIGAGGLFVLLLAAGCGRDFSLPVEGDGPISALTVRPDPARADLDLEIEFVLEAAASGDPLISLLDRFATKVSGPDGQGGYRYLYPVRGDEPEGQAVAISLSVPTSAEPLTESTTVTFDFTPPGLVRAEASPATAGAGETVTLSLRLDEPVRPPVAEVGGRAFDCNVGGEGLSATFDCTYLVVGDERTGDWGVELQLEDAAGNISRSTLADLGAFSFGSAPVLGPVIVEPPVARAATPVSIRFGVDRALSTHTVEVGGISAVFVSETQLLPTDAYAFEYLFEYPVTGNELEALHGVAVTVRDAFGGTSMANAQVTLDFTPPAAVNSSAAPAVVGTGEVVTLSLETDEPLTSLAAIIGFPERALDGTCRMDGDPTHWLCDYRARGIELDGLTSVLFGMSDLAGNLGTALVDSLFAFDVTCQLGSGARLVRGTSAPDRFSADPGTFEAGASVDLLFTSGGALLVTVQAAADGSVPRTDLPVARSELYFQATDARGNVCPEARATTSLIAGFEGKTRGTATNPSILREATIQELVVPLSELATATEASQAVYDGAALPDAATGDLQRNQLAAGTGAQWWYMGPPTTGSPPWPSWRTQHMQTWDAARHRTLIFGGTDNGIYQGERNDTWLWDGRSWTEFIQAGPVPSSRCDAGIGHHPLRQETILVLGGRCFGGGGMTLPDDMWIFNASGWTQAAFSPGVGLAPDSATGLVIVYDEAREELLLVGGDNQNDTRAWDGSWSLRATSGSIGSGNETPWWSWLPRGFYDPGRQSVMVFGGHWPGNYATWNDAIWEWNGTAWAMPPFSPQPPGTAAHAMAYDQRRGVGLLVGGYQNDANWEWDGTTWRNAGQNANALDGSEGPPPNLYSPGLSYDAYRGRLVAFGGENSSYIYGEVWEYSYPFELPVLQGHLDLEAFVPSAIRLSVIAGGAATDEHGAALTGVTVYVWDRIAGYWEEVGSHSAGPGATEAERTISWTPSQLFPYLSGNALEVLVRPVEGATHRGASSLSLELLELTADE